MFDQLSHNLLLRVFCNEWRDSEAISPVIETQQFPDGTIKDVKTTMITTIVELGQNDAFMIKFNKSFRAVRDFHFGEKCLLKIWSTVRSYFRDGLCDVHPAEVE